MSDIRILAFMRQYPGAHVSLPPKGHQRDPWTLAVYHGILQPGMNEWLDERDMKAVYNSGEYELQASYNPQKFQTRVRGAIGMTFLDMHTIGLLQEAGLLP